MARDATQRSASLWLLLSATPLLAATRIDTQTFVEQAVAARVAETEAAQLALRRSQSADVKDFAQQVIDHHPRENADLQARNYETSVALFNQAAEQGDEELQAFARAKLPVLKHHLQTARMLTRAHPMS